MLLLLSLAAAVSPEPQIVDVGNQRCPITGDPVDGIHTFVHNGKRYNLCCSGTCAEPFAKDPEKFASIAENEVK